MAKKEEKTPLVKKEKDSCFSTIESDSQSSVLFGFKVGFGFWLAGLTILLLILAVAVGLYYLLSV